MGGLSKVILPPESHFTMELCDREHKSRGAN